MKIAFIDIHNFRKLEKCRIELSGDKTVFVGANNSGKTSAMDAFGKFLIDKDRFIFNDIFVLRRTLINSIGEHWNDTEADVPNDLSNWDTILPAMDLWLEVADNEMQYISHIIPTLKWKGENIGVRLSYQPINIEKLFHDYRVAFSEARNTEATTTEEKIKSKLWPKSLCDFLEKNLNNYFALKAYKLDPAKQNEVQVTKVLTECSSDTPLEGLIKIDMVPAQRGFSDVESSSTQSMVKNKVGGSLSSQLRSYYDKHLDPQKTPTAEDLDMLVAIERATDVFNTSLNSKFKNAIEELEQLGYPGVSDPKITITTKVSALETLKHDSAVQYALTKDDNMELYLPEKYNGLGYQNLISIVFQLMRFRDEWVKKGKARKNKIDRENTIEPIHLVLLEEPEAHLHMQVQQILIRKAHDILCNDPFLKEYKGFKTQLIVSTHSSHIAKECNFENLRYFKRLLPTGDKNVGTSTVINLSTVFGGENETARFVTRYLQATHCDLFFADAAVLIEGTAEEMLLPHFIKNKFPGLHQRYLSILTLKGRHTHRLAPLLDKMAIPILVIADLDVGEPSGHHKKAKAEHGKSLISTNYTINTWLMNEKSLDALLCKKYEEKVIPKGTDIKYLIRVAYQTPVSITVTGLSNEAIPTTFEDSLIYTNLKAFEDKIEEYQSQEKDIAQINFLKELVTIISKSTNHDELKDGINALINSQSFKALFALDLIYEFDPEVINIPEYINEGLQWLQQQLMHNE